MAFQEHILLFRAPDRPGTLATLSNELHSRGGDVRDAKSFGDEVSGLFFVRMQLCIPSDQVEGFRSAVAAFADGQGVTWRMFDTSVRQKVVVAVSKFDHCLVDLLHRQKIGALGADIVGVISNHETTRSLVEWHGVPFYHLPITPETKPEQEKAFLKILDDLDADLTVLARYMQILSTDMCAALDGRCINIHHSFLPSFKGAKPYHRAFERGVKLIGATAHYVTTDLDEGPIIEQDVRRVTHTTSADQMIAIGRETEASVLARAVTWHLEHRVMLNGNKTVVFAP